MSLKYFGIIALALVASSCAQMHYGRSSGGYGVVERFVGVVTDPNWEKLLLDPSLPTQPTTTKPPGIRRLALAELGEASPLAPMLAAMRDNCHLDAIQPVAGGARLVAPMARARAASTRRAHALPASRTSTSPTNEEILDAAEVFRPYVMQIRAAFDDAVANARRARADYVLVVYASNSATSRDSVFPPIDFLIFPLFIIPHQIVVGHGTGRAWLVDVRSSKILLVVTETAIHRRLCTYANISSAEHLAVGHLQEALSQAMAKTLANQLDVTK